MGRSAIKNCRKLQIMMLKQQNENQRVKISSLNYVIIIVIILILETVGTIRIVKYCMSIFCLSSLSLLVISIPRLF